MHVFLLIQMYCESGSQLLKFLNRIPLSLHLDTVRFKQWLPIRLGDAGL